MERQTWKDKMLINKNADEVEDDSDEGETSSHGSGLISIKFEENEKQKVKAAMSTGKKSGSSSGGGGGGGGGFSAPSCQADKCGADLSDAKIYHRRHKVCEFHSKAATVIVTGARQRFCQQCSRFHELPEFDESKRSCRRRLAGHNERRRKSSGEPYGDGSGTSRRGIAHQYRSEITQTSTKYHMTTPAASGNSANSKHFQIR